MVELQKAEQRGQAVKRLRSLFDMHRVSFGAPENLNGLLTSLHDDRHFAMDFWSVIGALSEDEEAPLNDEEMLDTVIESATGVESTSLPQEMQPQVTELRQLLSGVDIERPAELPEAIAKPDDDLLSHVTTLLENTLEPVHNDAEVREARKSLGEILARLEQTSRELRERLALIDARNKEAAALSAVAGSPAAETAEPEPAQMPQRFAAETKASMTPSSAESMPKQQAPTVQIGGEQQSLPMTPQVAPASDRERVVHSAVPAMPPAAASQAEVFAPRPAHTLSQRGLSIPDPEDDPSIPTPLANYSDLEKQSSGARYGIAALVIAFLGIASFFGARTEKGHALLSNATASLSSWTEGTKQRVGVLKQEATPQTPPPSSENNSTVTPASAQNPPTQEQAPRPDQAGTPPVASSNGPTQPRQPAPVASHANVTPPAKAPLSPKKQENHAEPLVVAKAHVTEPLLPSGNAVHVPAAAMARHLIASRVPVYPPSAKAQDIEGPVVMDVLISESGFVKSVRAVDGDKHLRAAAEEAVSKWRYIPYLQNGRPVEVVTTVRLDFRLP